MSGTATLVCARPTRLYPEGRTGKVAGFVAHQTAKEEACDECRAARRVYDRAEYDRNRESYVARNLRQKHPLTLEEYDAKLAEQGGGCAICGTTEPGGRGRFHVDHDHDCCPGQKSCVDCMRGLLCTNCNAGLGNFDDDVDRMTAAVAYILTHREARNA